MPIKATRSKFRTLQKRWNLKYMPIINSDDKGSQIEVLDGAFKGTRGFVPSDNVH